MESPNRDAKSVWDDVERAETRAVRDFMDTSAGDAKGLPAGDDQRGTAASAGPPGPTDPLPDELLERVRRLRYGHTGRRGGAMMPAPDIAFRCGLSVAQVQEALRRLNAETLGGGDA